MESPDFIVVVGPMFCGKTSRIITEGQKYLHAGRRIVYFRPRIANRNDDEIVISQGRIKLRGVEPTLIEDLAHAAEIILTIGRRYDVVMVDEGHFLPLDVFRTLTTLHCEGRSILFCGCDTDFLGEPFDTVAKVMALPEAQIHKLTAFCARCGSRATRSQKLVSGKPAPLDSQRFETGGKKKYRALCLACFNETNPAAEPELSANGARPALASVQGSG
ncbi:MAG: thymidine kinase [Candidatus Kerfeldbacteria bacterium]|nr:thymidine kinase [Candidatus Kerfeldbacteria bacterium]